MIVLYGSAGSENIIELMFKVLNSFSNILVVLLVLFQIIL
jgi:hypothetical protein